MSEQLYRPNPDAPNEWARDGQIADLVKRGSLVPVEPCEHGNYADHWFEDSSDGGNGQHPVFVWCAGAGHGGSDA